MSLLSQIHRAHFLMPLQATIVCIHLPTNTWMMQLLMRGLLMSLSISGLSEHFPTDITGVNGQFLFRSWHILHHYIVNTETIGETETGWKRSDGLQTSSLVEILYRGLGHYRKRAKVWKQEKCILGEMGLNYGSVSEQEQSCTELAILSIFSYGCNGVCLRS